MLWAPPWRSGDVHYLTAPEMRDLRSLLQISGALGVAVFIKLSIYMGPVARQVDYHQASSSNTFHFMLRIISLLYSSDSNRDYRPMTNIYIQI